MNKLLVITGGTRGIGRAVILKFASLGFDIFTCARSEDHLKQLREEVRKNFPECGLKFMALDLSAGTGVKKFIDFIRALKRPVDVLVNNAGVFLPGQIINEPEGNLEKIMKLNVYQVYDLTRGLVSDMIANKSGHIFNLCSTASITPYSNGGSYCISKYALYGMTKVLREELKDKNIRVTAVLPGATLTSSWEGADFPPERFMKPEDVAEAIYNAWTLSSSSVVEEILIRPQLGDINE
jgi:short-subunit dehydrogenase